MKATTRKEACEAYTHRWQATYFDQAKWAEVLELLYSGKGPAEIVADLKLDPSCRSSLTVHAREHRGYIAFMRGVRLKDRRLQFAGTLSEAWRALIERIFTIGMDPSTKPGTAVKAAAVAQKEITELGKLAAAAVAEFTQAERADSGKPIGDVEEMVRRIASEVFGIRAEKDKE